MSENRPDVEIAVPAEPESVVLARQAVRGIVDALGWSEERRTDVSIAVTEACTNAVLHAYPEGGGEYEVRVWATPEELVVSVRDYGQGISPRIPSAVAGLGLGMPLMMAICDEVSFSRNGEEATEVRLVFSAEGRAEHE